LYERSTNRRYLLNGHKGRFCLVRVDRILKQVAGELKWVDSPLQSWHGTFAQVVNKMLEYEWDGLAAIDIPQLTAAIERLIARMSQLRRSLVEQTGASDV